jgi:hypothetical protein
MLSVGWAAIPILAVNIEGMGHATGQPPIPTNPKRTVCKGIENYPRKSLLPRPELARRESDRIRQVTPKTPGKSSR